MSVNQPDKSITNSTGAELVSTSTSSLANENASDILENIKNELKVITERQTQRTSPEFNALMEGYVSKANESESLRVKYNHVESNYEEIKQELKVQKATHRQLSSDLDATREALKLSELDISKYKRDLEQLKKDNDLKISDLVDQRDNLSEKVRDFTAWKESTENSMNDMKAEILDYKHKIKQLEQERFIEQETTKRTLQENSRVVKELKEQLELREREASYKNALIEQLIRQTSMANSGSSTTTPINISDRSSLANIDPNASVAEIDAAIKNLAQNQAHASNISSDDDASDDDKKKFTWGAFRK